MANDSGAMARRECRRMFHRLLSDDLRRFGSGCESLCFNPALA
jgi:hypothetical protein